MMDPSAGRWSTTGVAGAIAGAALAALLSVMAPLPASAHSDASSFSGGTGTHDHPVENIADPVRYPARVIVDPRKVVNVTMRVNARIVDVLSGPVGTRVTAGQPLARFTSAELRTLQTSYIETYRHRDRVLAASVTAGQKLIEARMNLQWRGLSEADVSQIERTRTPVEEIALLAPSDGYLTQVNIRDETIVNAGTRTGLFTAAGTAVFQIADLRAKLIVADLPQEVTAGLAPGDKLTLSLPGIDTGGRAEATEATVTTVLPFLSPNTPWLRRVHAIPSQEAALLLRPGQLITVMPLEAAPATDTAEGHHD